MRKLTLALAMVMAMSLSAFAQDPKVDVFGGYSFITTDILETPEVVPGGRDNFPAGWEAAVTVYTGHTLGITGDFSGHTGSQNIQGFGVADLTFNTFLFGPKLVHHEDNLEMYIHTLFGVARANITALGTSNKTTDFTAAFGGGIDYKFGNRFAYRVMQADYVYGELYSSVNNTLRVSTGIVVRW
jgi:hypothetical protein